MLQKLAVILKTMILKTLNFNLFLLYTPAICFALTRFFPSFFLVASNQIHVTHFPHKYFKLPQLEI